MPDLNRKFSINHVWISAEHQLEKLKISTRHAICLSTSKNKTYLEVSVTFAFFEKCKKYRLRKKERLMKHTHTFTHSFILAIFRHTNRNLGLKIYKKKTVNCLSTKRHVSNQFRHTPKTCASCSLSSSATINESASLHARYPSRW